MSNAEGAYHIERGNWKEGENGFADVAKAVGHLEMKDFNHCFRMMETAALRIKNPNAIFVFE